jgi:hypothetical protein
MFKKIFKFLGLANNTASMLNPEAFRNMVLHVVLNQSLEKNKNNNTKVVKV